MPKRNRLPLLAVGAVALILLFTLGRGLTLPANPVSGKCQASLDIFLSRGEEFIQLGDKVIVRGTVTQGGLTDAEARYTRVDYWIGYLFEMVESGSTTTDNFGNFMFTVTPWASGEWFVSIQSGPYNAQLKIVVSTSPFVTVTRTTTSFVGTVTQTLTFTETLTRSYTTTTTVQTVSTVTVPVGTVTKTLTNTQTLAPGGQPISTRTVTVTKC